MRVYVLLINPRSEQEGIHTLRRGGRNTVLLFEHEDDAIRFALLLEAQDFPSVQPEGIEADEVKEFCASAGYDWELVTSESLVVPPDVDVPLEEMDWKKEQEKNLRGEQEEEDESATPEEEASKAELDRIRRQLEGLL